MGPEIPQGPDPFRHSRAHSWPGEGATRLPPTPEKPKFARGRLALLIAIPATVLLVIVGTVAALASRPEPPPPPPPPITSIPASVVPEPTNRGLPRSSPTTTRKGAKPSGTPTTGPIPIVGELPPYLLEASDLARVAPGQWGVSTETIAAPAAGAHPLVSCAPPRPLPPHVARYFLVPAVPGPWEPGGPEVGQRLLRYSPAEAAKAVEGFRKTVAECATRPRTGYSERWSIVTDAKTETGDVLVVRRLPEPKPPQGNSDFGTDYIVVRNGDVVSITDFSRGRAAPNTAQTTALMRAIRAKLCGGTAC